MLRQLSIRDVVLIDRLDLEFEPGLGVLTGETGAGKSILLDSLGLALGLRADSGLVRAGEVQASVAAEFELPGEHPVFALLAEQGIDREHGEPLLVRRTLKADGGSRAFAGGAGVPASLLRDVANGLVEIHGQHDDRGLLNPRGHRALLDAFGKLDLTAVAEAWTQVGGNGRWARYGAATSSGSTDSKRLSAWPNFMAPPLSSPSTRKSCSAARCCSCSLTSSAGVPPNRLPSPRVARPAKPSGSEASFAPRRNAERASELPSLAAAKSRSAPLVGLAGWSFMAPILSGRANRNRNWDGPPSDVVVSRNRAS